MGRVQFSVGGRLWMPTVLVAMAATVVLFNITALQVALEGIADSFRDPASSVKTTIVIFWLVVAALILPASKLDPSWGARRVFRSSMVLFAAAMTTMALSVGSVTMTVAQVAAGVATAAVMPTLPPLIAEHYDDDLQKNALDWLAMIQAVGLVPALLVAGAFTTWVTWRVAFALLAVWALAISGLAARLRSPVPPSPARVDVVGLMLEVLGILFIGWGLNRLTDWTPFLARSRTSYDMINLAWPPVLLVLGAILIRVFVAWSRKRLATGRTPLIALGMLGQSPARSVLLSIFAVAALGAAITFVVPLYIENVQERTSLFTSVALMPFAVSSFVAGLLVVQFRGRLHPRRIARYAFLAVAVGAALLGENMRGRWSDLLVIVGMILAGIGDGALSTLLFKLLMTRGAVDATADVAPVCSSSDYFGAAVGTALASALVIGMLGASIYGKVLASPVIPPELRQQINLDKVLFVSNERLRESLSRTPATAVQVEEAIRINTEGRLHALRICFFALAALAGLAVFPARALPDWVDA